MKFIDGSISSNENINARSIKMNLVFVEKKSQHDKFQNCITLYFQSDISIYM